MNADACVNGALTVVLRVSLGALVAGTDPVTGAAIVAKTGMGSSAAMVTSLTAAVLLAFGAITLPQNVTASGV